MEIRLYKGAMAQGFKLKPSGAPKANAKKSGPRPGSTPDIICRALSVGRVIKPKKAHAIQAAKIQKVSPKLELMPFHLFFRNLTVNM